MPTMDQVAWATANITVGGESTLFTRGALLPDPANAEEQGERGILRSIGAIRTVEVVYTPEELAAQAKERAEVTAQREAAYDAAADASASQVPGPGEPGRPVLQEPSGNPVVVGDEKLRQEHEQQRSAAAQQRQRSGQSQGQRPGSGSSGSGKSPGK